MPGIDYDALSPDDWVNDLARMVAESIRDTAAVMAEWGRDDVAILCRALADKAEDLIEDG